MGYEALLVGRLALLILLKNYYVRHKFHINYIKVNLLSYKSIK